MAETKKIALNRGLVLFGHGARDPRWVEPFVRLLSRVQTMCPGALVKLAYLELVSPNLDVAVAELVGAGCTEVRVAPVFVGQGGHVREQLPAMILALQSRYPNVTFSQIAAVGEDDAVLDAIAAYSVRDW